MNPNIDALPTSTAPASWLEPLRSWPHQLRSLLATETSVVRVLVASVRGSAPREAGACMLVTATRLIGTVGGGYLEWKALTAARALLMAQAPARLQRYILGTELAQCCGGVVELWLERWTPADCGLLDIVCASLDGGLATTLETSLDASQALRRNIHPTGSQDTVSRPLRLERDDHGLRLTERLMSAAPPVWLFGAGHVGQALARVLADLPLQLSWIDARAGALPMQMEGIRLRAAQPLEVLREAPAQGRYVVMTHDHALDYAIVLALLRRGDARYLGLIGSESKAARFRSRLLREGLNEQDLAPLVCPIGVAGISSKLPAAIAVSIAAQLLQTLPVPASSSASPLNGTEQPVTDCTLDGCETCHKKPR